MELKKMKIIKVERNSFTGRDDDKEIKYCKVYFLDPVVENEDSIGYDVKSYTTGYDNYDTVVDFYNTGKVVDVEFELVEFKDIIKRKLKKINGLDL